MKKLKEKEKLFCRFFIDTGDPVYAAQSAKMNFEEEKARLLIYREEIIEEIERLLKARRRMMLLMCENTMMKLICAPENEALGLAVGLRSRGQELRGVSEIKSTDKGAEVRFFDKVKVFEKLSSISSVSSDSTDEGLIGALTTGAKALSFSESAVNDSEV